MRSAWSALSRVRGISHGLAAWIRREREALSVTDNCRGRVDDAYNSNPYVRFQTLNSLHCILGPWGYEITVRQYIEAWGMIEYRAFFIGNDGHLSGFQPLVCADDAEAIAKAKRLLGGRDIELWSGPRLVIRLLRERDLNLLGT